MNPRCLILVFAIILAGSAAWAQDETAAPVDSVAVATDTTAVAPPDSLPVPTLAVLPPSNHTQQGAAQELLLPLLYRHLAWNGIDFLDAEEIRPVLRANRIRSRGTIGYTDAEILAEATGVRHLLLVSWDIFKTEFNPEIAISLRVLDLESMSLVGAVTLGASGEDFTGLMGLGTVERMEELADIVMKRAMTEVFPLADAEPRRLSARGCFNFALVPFDNYSDTPFAGDIVTNILLSRLLRAGYFVVEPGFVKELGLTREVVNRGRIDKGSARALLKRFDTCRVLTGEVEIFNTAPGAAAMTVPSFALGLRIMTPEDGTLYMTEELQGRGDEGEGFFQGRRVHALVTLVDGMLGGFLAELTESNRKDILYGRPRPTD